MAQPIHYITQGDRLPALVATLIGGDGVAANLSPANTTVTFSMRKQDTQVVVLNKVPCALTTPAAGVVTYSWAVGDTAVAGIYEGEFEIVWPDTKAQTVPNDSKFLIAITAQIT